MTEKCIHLFEENLVAWREIFLFELELRNRDHWRGTFGQ